MAGAKAGTEFKTETGIGSKAGTKAGKPGAGRNTEQLEEARKIHRCAVTGGKEEVTEAFVYFEKALREDPHNNLLQAYHADCLSMVGRESGDHGLLFGNAIKALIDIDKAINGDPDNIEIRLLRASHSYRLIPKVWMLPQPLMIFTWKPQQEIFCTLRNR